MHGLVYYMFNFKMIFLEIWQPWLLTGYNHGEAWWKVDPCFLYEYCVRRGHWLLHTSKLVICGGRNFKVSHFVFTFGHLFSVYGVIFLGRNNEAHDNNHLMTHLLPLTCLPPCWGQDVGLLPELCLKHNKHQLSPHRDKIMVCWGAAALEYRWSGSEGLPLKLDL